MATLWAYLFGVVIGVVVVCVVSIARDVNAIREHHDDKDGKK